MAHWVCMQEVSCTVPVAAGHKGLMQPSPPSRSSHELLSSPFTALFSPCFPGEVPSAADFITRWSVYNNKDISPPYWALMKPYLEYHVENKSPWQERYTCKAQWKSTRKMKQTVSMVLRSEEWVVISLKSGWVLRLDVAMIYYLPEMFRIAEYSFKPFTWRIMNIFYSPANSMTLAQSVRRFELEIQLLANQGISQWNHNLCIQHVKRKSI